MAWPTNIDPGLFVPTTTVWDIGQIYNIDVTSNEFKELLVRLYQTTNNISLALNLKDSGYYAEQEFVTGAQYPPTTPTVGNSPTEGRQVYRKMVSFGALPNATSASVAHGITTSSTFYLTALYAGASNPGTAWLSIPYASPTLNENISISMDATNITITTGIDRTAYTTCYVVIEYLKS